jgi:tricarballylate dehydrogenase
MTNSSLLIIGSGNAALCAGIAALEKGLRVTMLEKADEAEWGGNSRYTAGAMRFAYDSLADLEPLLLHPDDERIARTDFGSYPTTKFLADLQHFNEGEPPNELQQFLVSESLSVVQWLASHNVRFAPIYSRQTFVKDGKYIFWGGLTLEAEGEGNGLVQAERAEFERLGGTIRYGCDVQELLTDDSGAVTGVRYKQDGHEKTLTANAVVLACGGFESNKKLRVKYLGEMWADAKVRGTRHNLGAGLEMATAVGAGLNGYFGGSHATPMDRYMPDYGNLDLPHIERKHYRKISYLFGIMLNANGQRFVDEGADFRNYTYAQYGKAVLQQPGHVAWQIFDATVDHLLYSEYKTDDASFTQADSLDDLIGQLEGIDRQQALETIRAYNEAVQTDVPFDPTVKDGRGTTGLSLPKSNWANVLATPPFRAYPVTGGITFTYGGLNVNTLGEVLTEAGEKIAGLFAAGELVGGVFFYGYPGGSGLTSGAVFGRSAGHSAAAYCL